MIKVSYSPQTSHLTRSLELPLHLAKYFDCFVRNTLNVAKLLSAFAANFLGNVDCFGALCCFLFPFFFTHINECIVYSLSLYIFSWVNESVSLQVIFTVTTGVRFSWCLSTFVYLLILSIAQNPVMNWNILYKFGVFTKVHSSYTNLAWKNIVKRYINRITQANQINVS